PLCFPFRSASKKPMFGIPENIGLKNALESMVIFISGYALLRILMTGTIMATSPIAEDRMMRRCFGGFMDFIFYFAAPDSVRRRCTFSSVYRLSCIFYRRRYRREVD